MAGRAAFNLMASGNLSRPLESNLEQKVVEYSNERGVLSLKLNVLGRVGWPDRLFLYKGRVLFIEFKRQGEKPRKLQEYVHNQLRNQGFCVVVVDNFSQGYARIDDLTQGRPVV